MYRRFPLVQVSAFLHPISAMPETHRHGRADGTRLARHGLGAGRDLDVGLLVLDLHIAGLAVELQRGGCAWGGYYWMSKTQRKGTKN